MQKTVKKKRLINTKDLEYIVELALLSGWIKNADPLSLIISANIGAGKTELLKRFKGTRGTKYLSEATAYGIKTELLEDITAGKIRHLLYGDLLVPLSKQKKTKDDFIAFLNTICEEGIESIYTYAQKWESDKPEPVKCGIITTIAKPDFMRKSRRWFELGFLSRAIPITYGYSTSTQVEIYRHIAKADDISNISKKKIRLPKTPKYVKQNPRLNLRLIELSMKMAEWEKVYGFRRQEQLQTLMMANALKNRRKYVKKEDYDKIMYLSKYINLEFKEI